MTNVSDNNNRYRLCPKCGNFSHVAEEQFFCILCGTKLIEACNQCGKPILHPQGRFCHHCGATYRTVPADATQ
ncbi:MAG: zinc ribbon domain-containing protein [Ignavibacteriales bacterium]|nr:zinc ribbon domain-containing protein [Ignavibacteriales bacterium]